MVRVIRGSFFTAALKSNHELHEISRMASADEVNNLHDVIGTEHRGRPFRPAHDCPVHFDSNLFRLKFEE